MIILDLEYSDIPPTTFVDYYKKHGVIVFPSGRWVFHYQTPQDGANRLLIALQELMEAKKEGRELSARNVLGGYT